MKRYILELLDAFQGHYSKLQTTGMHALKKNSTLKYIKYNNSCDMNYVLIDSSAYLLVDAECC